MAGAVSLPKGFWARCHALPAGHGHCRHGHLVDCPTPDACPPVPAPQRHVWLVTAGRLAVLLDDERAARVRAAGLRAAGAQVRLTGALPLRAALATLGADIEVIDERNKEGRST